MSTPSFSVNERVLCYHGPLIYEAKVLKCEVWDETNTKLDTVGPHYFVHYKGWKQTCVSPNHMATLTLAVYADHTLTFTLLLLLFLFAAGTNGSPRRASSNSTRPTCRFKRTFPKLKPLPRRPARPHRKPPPRLVGHKREEDDVRRAGAGPRGDGMTTTGREGRRCVWWCRTRSKSSSWTIGRR